MIAGLAAVLSPFSDLRLAGSAASVEEIAAKIAEIRFDILLAGQPPAMRSALPLLAEVRQCGLTVPVVIWVASLSEVDVFRALQMGARGILLRTQCVQTLVSCLRAVHDGQVWLDPSLSSRHAPFRGKFRITPRERQIIALVCRGLKNRDIAEEMKITAGTVKVHLMHIFEKTGVRDRFQLAIQGQQILAAADRKDQFHTAIV